MPKIPSFSYVLPLVCLASWQCGSSTSTERRDAASDQTPSVPDPGPDASEDTGPDVSSPDAADTSSKADTADGRADAWLTVETPASEVPRDFGAPDGRRQCNDLLPDGPRHDVVAVDHPAPTPMGGTIEDGLYYETAAQVFESGSGNNIPMGSQRRLTMRIEGPILQAAYTTTADGETRWETAQMRAASDADPTAFAIAQLCPGSTSSELDLHYSFVGTGPGATFTIIYPPYSTGETFVLTLTKQ